VSTFTAFKKVPADRAATGQEPRGQWATREAAMAAFAKSWQRPR